MADIDETSSAIGALQATNKQIQSDIAEIKEQQREIIKVITEHRITVAKIAGGIGVLTALIIEWAKNLLKGGVGH